MPPPPPRSLPPSRSSPLPPRLARPRRTPPLPRLPPKPSPGQRSKNPSWKARQQRRPPPPPQLPPLPPCPIRSRPVATLTVSSRAIVAARKKAAHPDVALCTNPMRSSPPVTISLTVPPPFPIHPSPPPPPPASAASAMAASRAAITTRYSRQCAAALAPPLGPPWDALAQKDAPKPLTTLSALITAAWVRLATAAVDTPESP
mmetsp:Transcript_15694/g.38529  ORF Transcript_15694/g.38529 Transcript_15694/m.38529 type:complete len:203 (+) Transcript_15694:3273-3881(+)